MAALARCSYTHPRCWGDAAQVVLPEAGARLLMASDGLWDCIAARRAVTLARRAVNTTAVAPLLLTIAMRAQDHIIMDDITVLAVDLLPPGCPSFREVCRAAKAARGGGGGCFCASPVLEEAEGPRQASKVLVVADVDSWVVSCFVMSWAHPGCLSLPDALMISAAGVPSSRLGSTCHR